MTHSLALAATIHADRLATADRHRLSETCSHTPGRRDYVPSFCVWRPWDIDGMRLPLAAGTHDPPARRRPPRPEPTTVILRRLAALTASDDGVLPESDPTLFAITIAVLAVAAAALVVASKGRLGQPTNWSGADVSPTTMATT